MTEPVRILVTNDDGIDSEGLSQLARAMTSRGEVTVVAPDREYSGASGSLGVLGSIQPEVQRARVEGVDDSWAVSGPPALCVMFATLGVFGHAFDLVVSGINPGANVGRAVYHSGTVGAALTARGRGITGIAVSQAVEGYGVEGQGWDEMLEGMQWEAAAEVASAVVGGLATALPRDGIMINVNVPNLALDEMSGWERTSIGRIPPRVISEASLVPKAGHPNTFKVVMKWGDAVSLPEGSDGGAIERGKVSVSFLGGLVDVGSRVDSSAETAAYSVVASALDKLLE
jgi:5'-nucleotidase